MQSLCLWVVALMLALVSINKFVLLFLGGWSCIKIQVWNVSIQSSCRKRIQNKFTLIILPSWYHTTLFHISFCLTSGPFIHGKCHVLRTSHIFQLHGLNFIYSLRIHFKRLNGKVIKNPYCLLFTMESIFNRVAFDKSFIILLKLFLYATRPNMSVGG